MYKIDVHEQIEMNIDIITELLYDEFFKEKSNKGGKNEK